MLVVPCHARTHDVTGQQVRLQSTSTCGVGWRTLSRKLPAVRSSRPAGVEASRCVGTLMIESQHGWFRLQVQLRCGPSIVLCLSNRSHVYLVYLSVDDKSAATLQVYKSLNLRRIRRFLSCGLKSHRECSGNKHDTSVLMRCIEFLLMRCLYRSTL